MSWVSPLLMCALIQRDLDKQPRVQRLAHRHFDRHKMAHAVNRKLAGNWVDQTCNLGSCTHSPTADANREIITVMSLRTTGLMLSHTTTEVDKSYCWDTFINKHLVNTFTLLSLNTSNEKADKSFNDVTQGLPETLESFSKLFQSTKETATTDRLCRYIQYD